MTFKVLNGLAPQYLSELLTKRDTHRTLRSHSGAINLHQPVGNTAYYGDRAFSICAPKLWNSLPINIRASQSLEVFKSRLKTYLFMSFYS